MVGTSVDILYDGRSFLHSTVDPATGAVTEPTYSSEGLLDALRRQETPASLEQRFTYLYFAGRPVAQLELDGSGGQTLRYLSTDHLGTPVVTLDETGAELWDSAFEPFGRDAEEATPDGALANDVFLRFPGQWEDGRWAGAVMGAEVFYNVHRWFVPAIGAYNRTDPLWAEDVLLMQPDSPLGHYQYGRQQPLNQTDSLGLRPIDPQISPKCKNVVADRSRWPMAARSCFMVTNAGSTYLRSTGGARIHVQTNCLRDWHSFIFALMAAGHCCEKMSVLALRHRGHSDCIWQGGRARYSESDCILG